ncbi:tellurite resistance/C4-dicarboxylate transporter family protein [Thiocystis violacea]|uniref:tellurite resistance/C4-dicarboxylate transporter family protein n=1 Tax=Thiocystis violacea TaxID=13725 RepID=UPI001906075C|nr:tellurite resistance/C4-dicarboxylate transporter family protein [Thiocystis violacea]MBK1717316.1 hypothetical protein [Thiocystis violacea]
MQQPQSEWSGTHIARDWISGLSPASFALVMATGIVSMAGEALGFHRIAMGLLALNLVAFTILWAMTLLRLVLHPERLLADLRTHSKGPGYFTIVAGTSVVGSQLLILTDQADLATGLWMLALGLWGLISYAFFTSVIVHPSKPSIEEGLSGVWLIASVATQSIAVLGALVAEHFPTHQEDILFLCLLFYFMGGMLYLNIMALVFQRLTFLAVEPGSLTPPYWISMGATAIATQAGATLVLHAGESPLLLELAPFIKGFTLFFWAAGTWWIPLLICLAVWTHWRKGVPLVYTPLFWGAVFPLGMYTVSTHHLAMALDMEVLRVIPAVTIYAAFLAWGLTFFGLLRRLVSILRMVTRLGASGLGRE